MKIDNASIFPTTISRTITDVSEEEKDCWFDLYLTHSNDDGKSHDFWGFEKVQTDERFHALFMDRLRRGVDAYFDAVGINPSKLDVQLTKCFFSVVDRSTIYLHDHAENHLSFTYYPNVAEGKDRDILFYINLHNNEPYTGFFETHADGYTKYNALREGFPVSEGTMYIFPSKLTHQIEKRDGDGLGTQPFLDKESLSKSRFCVAGDMVYTRKNNIDEYSRLLSSPENWRKV